MKPVLTVEDEAMTKPFGLNELEERVRETLGPVQVEVKPKAITKEAVTGPIVVNEVNVEEIVTIAPEEIPLHLRQGTAHVRAGRYQEALQEFQAILAVAPGNIETRIWIRKVEKQMSKPGIEGEVAVIGEAKPKYCDWMTEGIVSYRLCTSNYDCLTCEFGQTVDDFAQQQLAQRTAELAARQEALDKKESKVGDGLMEIPFFFH